MTEYKTNDGLTGGVHITSDVIAKIAGTAAAEIDGVVTPNTGVLGKKNFGKGVKVAISGNNAALDLNLSVKFGCKIQDVCVAVQKNIKAAIETMTGYNVTEININVTGVAFTKAKKSGAAAPGFDV